MNKTPSTKLSGLWPAINLLAYPSFNDTFKIHTNDSALQLGAAIIQKGKPIAFYSLKLTDTQQRYTVTKR